MAILNAQYLGIYKILLVTMAVSIESYNVNGFNDKKKCRTFLSHLKHQPSQFFFLQETHLNKSNITNITKHWEGSTFFSPGKYNTCGVIILATEKHLKPIDIICDDDGRYILTISCQGKQLTLCNIYAPSGGSSPNQRKRKIFFNLLTRLLQPHKTQHNLIILGGDFNMTTHSIDRRPQPQQPYKCSSITALNNLINSLTLTDIWRMRYPSVEEFTHISNVGSFTKIDRVYVSMWAEPCCTQVSHQPNIFSDHHNYIHISMHLIPTPRGESTWILNKTILDNPQYITLITNFWEEFITKEQNDQTLKAWWDEGKLHTKTLTIQFSKKENKKKKIISLQ